MQADPNPKLCECGCGEPAPIAKKACRAYGYAQGQAKRFVRGHSARLQYLTTVFDNPMQNVVVKANGCWEWTGSINPQGYGLVNVPGTSTTQAAHRRVYEFLAAPIPASCDLDHLCRNTSCVNPAHLEPVSHAENCRRGSKTKLTHAEAEVIRNSTEKGVVLARRYGVGPSAISRVRLGRTWTS